MGNTPALLDMHTDMNSAQGKNLGSRLSEESYIPMPLSMRKKLVEGKRFRHVVPSREDKDCKVQTSEDNLINMSTLKESTADINENIEESNKSECSRKIQGNSGYIDPIVTVLNINTVQNKSDTQVDFLVNKNMSLFDGTNDKPETSKHLPRSPTLTNRRYSLIDMRTGLKKSKFTLELEEKLRQSKLNLGFDDDTNDWREFTYLMENPECRIRVEPFQKGNLKLGFEENVGKGLEKVCLRDPLQYCANNCQILGLCSVRSPVLLPKQEHLEPPDFEDKISEKYVNVKNILKGDFGHHKKENCNCDHCTLAYLTEMGYPEDGCSRRSASVKVNRSPKESPRSGRKRIKERVRIVENDKTMKSIEISVSGRPSTINSSTKTLAENSSVSNVSTSASVSEGDTTNRKIKKMFQQNNALMKEIHRNRVRNQSGISAHKSTSGEDIFKTGESFNCISKEVLQVQMNNDEEHGNFETLTACSECSGKKPSSSTLGASISSSLSSVLSYKRVRQIFQTIIERNRSRRRPRKNIHKFRELEELGLGEVKNNRWYPSDSKTFSIWHGMHQSVQGIQAEFKKYPKSYLKRLD